MLNFVCNLPIPFFILFIIFFNFDIMLLVAELKKDSQLLKSKTYSL